MTSYLDTASSEPLHPAARAVLEQALTSGYADPRRLHGPARNARIILDNAREATADALGVRPDEVTFTPSGTHAVHLGV
ncbi:MAG: aminotransferase class V-fold PLP-dependent enzyme, partial [Rhodococcus sp. (in: high G+C Gram-positive bacteria)]